MNYRFLRHAQYKEITTNLVKEQEDREKERFLAQKPGKSLGYCVTKVFLGRHNTHAYSTKIGITRQTQS